MATDGATPIELSSLVAGDDRPGPARTMLVNPARPSEVVNTVALADAAVAEAAIDAAHRAAAAWRATSAPARGEVLRLAAQKLDESVETIARDLTREEGKTLAESARETQSAAKLFRYFAAQTLDAQGETYPSHFPDLLLYTRREPLGVVSVITPWNFPIQLPSWKIAAALAFGNTVVWKPAENVPRTTLHIASALVDAGLPDGVLNIVLGRGSQIGDILVTDPRVAAVTFTGSTPVGRTIQQRAVAAGKKVQLELGGKNPAIVLADADLERAAREISVAAFGATGQKCTATSRVLVERPVFDELVERLEAEAASWVLGDPLDANTTMGPVATAGQLDTVLGYLERARVEGARAVAGGSRADGALADGYFVAPTVLVDVERSHAVVREEIFGPVAAVLPVDSFADAVAEANNTPFGLSAGIFTADLSRALQFVEQSQAGIVRVNRSTSGVEYHVPFGGMKDSGYGQREQGKAAQDFFTESKTVYLAGP
ncbi:aldehyde dehydrogenase family protein [Kribbella shirazensis]|uniref:Aldehyde dehydrogenase (NAD+) n=1 Tax=Kribbella shirazensis TaxID=1105143 RepID=A0A7X6A5L7_9ACTN|nr:aldehyde dehydrogenase family protein [Kribbella shirazensis]NIK61414.1 aldehyde dehydrogenase (NAD+) [Kribbella shirazensis]